MLVKATSGKDGETDEKIQSQGPIPRGLYFLDPVEISETNIFRQFLGDWGEYRVPLLPAFNTNTHNRNNFFLHGGFYEKYNSK